MDDYQAKRGRPQGIPRDGSYGRGVRTVVVRVPEQYKEVVKGLLLDLPEFLSGWESRAKDTRDWTQAKRLLSEMRALFGFEGVNIIGDIPPPGIDVDE